MILDKQAKYPAIPRLKSGKDVSAITESIEILTGATGDGLDKALTVRDLNDLGFLDVEFRLPGPNPIIDIFPAIPSGTSASITGDVNEILTLLEGEIREDHLYQALNDRIDLIDGPTGLVNSVSTITATVNGHTSSIQTISNIQGDLSSEYMVKLDVNGYVAGFGLYNSGSSSTFIVRTDKFAIGQPGQAGKIPFIIGTVDGVATIALNAATFIPDVSIIKAKIANAAIGTAQIDDLAVTNAKIGVAAITESRIGDLAVTNAKIQDIAISTAKIEFQAVTSAKIDNLAVTNAKIQTAAVDTLQIAGNAVTVPAAASAGNAVNFTAVNLWLNMISVTVNFGATSPGKVYVSGSINFQATGSGSASTFAVRIEHNGNFYGAVGASVADNFSIGLTCSFVISSPGTGSQTFNIQGFKDTAAPYEYTTRAISVIGIRR